MPFAGIHKSLRKTKAVNTSRLIARRSGSHKEVLALVIYRGEGGLKPTHRGLHRAAVLTLISIFL